VMTTHNSLEILRPPCSKQCSPKLIHECRGAFVPNNVGKDVKAIFPLFSGLLAGNSKLASSADTLGDFKDHGKISLFLPHVTQSLLVVTYPIVGQGCFQVAFFIEFVAEVAFTPGPGLVLAVVILGTPAVNHILSKAQSFRLGWLATTVTIRF